MRGGIEERYFTEAAVGQIWKCYSRKCFSRGSFARGYTYDTYHSVAGCDGRAFVCDSQYSLGAAELFRVSVRYYSAYNGRAVAILGAYSSEHFHFCAPIEPV